MVVSFKEQFFRLFTELSSLCVCVGSWLLTPVYYSLTVSSSNPSVPSLCPAKCNFLGNKDENKMLPDFKKLQGTVKYRLQITKHATGAIFYFNYDKIHIT